MDPIIYPFKDFDVRDLCILKQKETSLYDLFATTNHWEIDTDEGKDRWNSSVKKHDAKWYRIEDNSINRELKRHKPEALILFYKRKHKGLTKE